MTQGGDEGQWWLREVVTKGSGEDGKWWRREVVTKGVWWLWEVVTKGTGDEGSVVTWGSGDEGSVVTLRSGDEGKWWWRECCKIHCTGCMNVAWALFWRGSRSTKPCVSPCKMAAAEDEGTSCVRPVRLRSFHARIGSSYWSSVFCNEWLFHVVPVCVVLCVSWISGCRSHWNGCMIVVMLCCHVRREMRVSHVMPRNAL